MSNFQEWRLPALEIGRRVWRFDEIDSTNAHCARYARERRHHGLVVMARAQKAGRGQHGRRWLCPPDTGVLMSVLLFPPQDRCRPVLLTAWAAVSVCDVVQAETGLTAQIKWPNDVLIDGRKVCGILIEQHQGVVVGIGLNVNQTAKELEAQGLNDAASLGSITNSRLDTERVGRKLIECLDRRYQQLSRLELSGLENDWRRAFGLLGRKVALECHSGEIMGKLVDLRFDGIVLDTGADELTILAPESIQHIHRHRD